MSAAIQLEIPSDIDSNIHISKKQFKKMIFIINALDKGWSVKKSNDSYIFTKKHINRREIFQENYLEDFLISNFSTDLLETPQKTN
jgi:hypothetical protein